MESIKAHDDAVNNVVAGFEGVVLTGLADGTVKCFKREMIGVATWHVLLQLLVKQEHAVTALTVTVAEGVVYSGLSDGLVNFWEREKHFMAHGGVLHGHRLAVLCLAAAGRLVLSGSADRSICVWSRDKGGDHTCLNVLIGHSGHVKCLAVAEDQESPDGDQRWVVYSGSLDRSVGVWGCRSTCLS